MIFIPSLLRWDLFVERYPMNSTLRFDSLFFRQDLNSIGIPFLFATLLFVLFPHPLSVFLLFVLAALFLFLSLGRKKRGEGTREILAALGIALALLSLSVHRYHQERDRSFLGETLSFEGVVTYADGEGADVSTIRISSRLSLKKLRIQTDTPPKVGSLVSGEGVFSAPSREDGMDGVDHLLSHPTLNVTGESVFVSAMARIREGFADRLGTHREGGFYRAILLGDRAYLTEEDAAAFRRADSSHLLAISGLHITQLFSLMYVFIRFVPLKRKVRFALCLPLILFLFFFTGGAVSVFRASVMAAFPLVGKLFSRRSSSVTSLVFAACLLVLWEPRCILSPSFLLSFVSAFSILTVSSPLTERLHTKLAPYLQGRGGWLFRFLFFFLSMQVISAVLFVFHAPLLLLLFGEISFLSPLFAILLIPLFSPCLPLGLLLGLFSFVPPLSPLFHSLATGYARLYLDFVQLLSSAGEKSVSFGSQTLPVALVLLAVPIFAMAKKARLRFFLYFYLAAFLLSAFALLLPS